MELLAQLAASNVDSDLGLALENFIRKAIADAEKLSRNEAKLRVSETKVEHLTLLVAQLRRLKFGAKSEAFVGLQGELFQESLHGDIADVTAQIASLEAKASAQALGTPGTPAAPIAAKPPRTGAGRQILPAHLARVDINHPLDSAVCDDCGADLIEIGVDITEKLCIKPITFYVERHHRPQCACKACQTVKAAPVAPAIIDGSLVTPSVLAWLAVSKYVDHLPAYRLEQIAARSGVPLARASIASWLGTIGVRLQPLVQRLIALQKQSSVLHADETPVKQLEPGRGSTKTAYLWVYCTGTLDVGGSQEPTIVVFDYQTSRAGKHAIAYLADWQGALMVDDYVGYKALFGDGVTELACWAHARRKFFELNKGCTAAGGSVIAQTALTKIGQLYEVERDADIAHDADMAEGTSRAMLRQSRSQPLLIALRDWLIQTRFSVAPNSATAKAIDYVLRRWDAFARYATNGRYPIDNNRVENALRPIALGRKNWLFTGSELAGQRTANIQSLLATAKANGIEPHAWLLDTLEKLPTWPNSRLDELLPLRKASTQV